MRAHSSILLLNKMVIKAVFLLLLLKLCASIDTITPTIPLKEGDTLISKSRKFTLGFFSPGNSTQRYVGIWFTQISEKTVVWVANRNNPVNGSLGILSVNESGYLTLNSGKMSIWSPNLSLTSTLSPANNSTSCQLLDTGNLVLTTNNGNNLLWQSFDHISDTYLPGMKLGLDRTAGLNRYLTSWKSKDDPSVGNLSLRIDPSGSPQIFLYEGADPVWRSGPWIGYKWSGAAFMSSRYSSASCSFVNNGNEISLSYNFTDVSILSFMVLDGIMGRTKFQMWQESSQRWIQMASSPGEFCDQYGACGSFGNCNPNSGSSFQCTCLPGYQPKLPQDWYMRDGSEGCVRVENKSMCRNGEGFLKVSDVKLPDTSKAIVKMSLTLKKCKEECLKNCSCLGYTIVSHDSRGGSDCVLYNQLMDTKMYPGGGQGLYLRLDANELAKYQKSKGLLANKKLKAVLIVLTTTFILSILYWLYWVHQKKKREQEEEAETALWMGDVEESDATSDLPFFTRNEITAATNNFSLANKLGEGGFGSVYKGQLENGQEIAVKKLAPNSGQGIQEFKNEVRLIAKLQHRNLVKMLGCCIQGEEKMLIYEFMPNRSLDTFIFNEETRSCLDWKKRFDIIMGIARGMLYLHQDSRLRIIHRDLKASNILLDKDMVPKISDFGTARIFGNEQVQVNTVRVVGTYGYMAPEYALQGLMSVKSDVFSFGVLLLEIITGRKNSRFYPDNPSITLVGHVWELWKQERSSEIVDPLLKDANIEEVLICVQAGLLCVQECADDRPTMSAVIFMLNNKVKLPSPKQPAFILNGSHHGANSSLTSAGVHSINELSITSMVEGR